MKMRMTTKSDIKYNYDAKKVKKHATRRKNQQTAIFYKKRHNVVEKGGRKSAALGDTIIKMIRGKYYDV